MLFYEVHIFMFHQKTLGIGIIFYFKGVKTEEISLGFEYGGVDIGDLGQRSISTAD